jgi:hypothetical protein
MSQRDRRRAGERRAAQSRPMARPGLSFRRSLGETWSAMLSKPASKSRVNKAGRALADAADADAPELRTDSVVIDEWRALHGEPMYWMAESVRSQERSWSR